MTDLFGYNGVENRAGPHARYVEPGFKETSTSKAAAKSMKPTAELIRTQVLESLKRSGPASPDEVAKRLGLSVLAVRPRFTELSASGKIVFAGERSPNESGRMAKVFRAL